jgi:hypothetical protein
MIESEAEAGTCHMEGPHKVEGGLQNGLKVEIKRGRNVNI